MKQPSSELVWGYTLNIDLVGPNGTETTSNSQITGNLSVIGIVSQLSTKDTKLLEADDAETICE